MILMLFPPPNSNLYHPNLNLLKHISKILVSKNQLDIEMDITMFYSLSSSIFNLKKKRVHFLTWSFHLKCYDTLMCDGIKL
jgi:hypothetical protein